MSDPTSGPAGFDLGDLFSQAQAMQQQLAEAQERQAAETITGSAGGGKVTVEVTGAYEFQRVSIAPDAVDADEVELLEELVLAALRDATAQITNVQEQSLGSVQMPDLSSLGGLGDFGALSDMAGLGDGVDPDDGGDRTPGGPAGDADQS